MTARQTGRYQAILDLLATSGRMTVGEIVAELGTSPATVRRDLERLEEQGSIIRTHGGAMLRKEEILKPPYVDRMERNQAEKNAIARQALSFIKDHETIVISMGTTPYQLSRVLAKSQLEVTVITNAVDVALELARNPRLRVIILGGEVGESYGIGDDWTVSMLKSLPQPDKAFIGADGISLEHGATSYRSMDAAINRLIASQARETILLVDYTKFGVSRFGQMASLDQLSMVICDEQLPADVQAQFRKAGVNLVVAPL